MDAVKLRARLHEYIEHADERHLEAIYVLLGQDMSIEEQRKAIIRQERTRYLQGEGKSFSPEEVREMALNKKKRHAL